MFLTRLRIWISGMTDGSRTWSMDTLQACMPSLSPRRCRLRQPTLPKKCCFPLTVEPLERREVLSATTSFIGDSLWIYADPSGGSVEVSEYTTPGSIGLVYVPPKTYIKVEGHSAGGDLTRSFDKLLVNSISFSGSNNADQFSNRTNLRSSAWGYGGRDWLSGGPGRDYLEGGDGEDTAHGGLGDDVLHGGPGNDLLIGDTTSGYYYYSDPGASVTTSSAYTEGGKDVLFGEDGEDQLFGCGGDDTLYGDYWYGDSSGNDRLYGNHGNDILYGGRGNDSLRGQVGDDNLYGGEGEDELYGYAGNDGLYGGSANDVLDGGLGADRFLVMTDNAGRLLEDRIAAVAPEDAQIHFVNGQTFDTTLGSGIGLVRAFAGTWVQNEIELIDGAFAALVQRTHNTVLLEKSDSSVLTYVRQGTVSNINSDGSLSVNSSVGGWNSGTAVYLINNTFTSNDKALRTVFHELAHNWDEQLENRFVADFRGVAGWREFSALEITAGATSGWERAKDGSRWYFVDRDSGLDGFARTYGKTNPLEDFATSFEAYMMAAMGKNYYLESPAAVRARLSGRFAVLDNFFASISA